MGASPNGDFPSAVTPNTPLPNFAELDYVRLYTPDGQLIDPPALPPSLPDARTQGFNTGIRRLHCSPTGAAPKDGSTPDLSFTDLQLALDALEPGDVLTVGEGDFFGTFSRSGLAGTTALPVWIAEEELGTTRILDVKQAAFNGTQAWSNEGGGRYSADIGDTYVGVHNGDFLPKYSSIATLTASSVNGKNKPSYGIAMSGSRVHIKLRGNADPNGESIMLTATAARSTVEFFNCNNVIWDGFQVEGSGRHSGVAFDTACANPTVRHLRGSTSRFQSKVKDDAIVEWCDFTLADRTKGFKAWMREVVALNGNQRQAFFDIVKGDLADGTNAFYEGALSIGSSPFASGGTQTNGIFRFNAHVGVIRWPTVRRIPGLRLPSQRVRGDGRRCHRVRGQPEQQPRQE